MSGFITRLRDLSRTRLLLIAAIIALGGWLRFWQLGEMLIFADELHSLVIAAEKSYLWIATHFADSDACIPLTLYNKTLLETIGLTEWTMRLPSMLAGLAILPLAAYGAWRFISFDTALLTTGVLSFSPYFVYLSREARPYPIISLMFTGAILLVFAWRRTRKSRFLEGAAAICAVAAYFHPVVLPAVLVLGCYPLAVLLGRDRPKSGWTRYIRSLVLFSALLLLMLGPPALSLFAGIIGKSAKGVADAGTAFTALPLVFSTPVAIPAVIWLALASIGAASLYRRYRLETIWIILLLASQTLALHIAQPNLLEIPWVWLRYQVHLLPVFLLLCAAGLLTVLRLACTSSKYFTGIQFVITGLLLLFCAHQVACHRYGVRPDESFNAHPMAVYLPNIASSNTTIVPPSNFYRRILDEFAPDYLVEAPMLFTFPLYGLYQPIHGRPLRTAGLGSGYAQAVFTSHPGFHFQTVLPVATDGTEDQGGSGLLLVHKNIKKEIQAAYEAARRIPLADQQLQGIEMLFHDPRLSILFGKEPIISDPRLRDRTPLYEDKWLVVYPLAAN